MPVAPATAMLYFSFFTFFFGLRGFIFIFLVGRAHPTRLCWVGIAHLLQGRLDNFLVGGAHPTRLYPTNELNEQDDIFQVSFVIYIYSMLLFE